MSPSCDDLQRRHQLAREIVLPARARSRTSVASDCTRGRPPKSLPKFELDAPDAGDHMAVDAEAGLGRGERLAPLLHGGAAVLHPLLVDERRQIIPDRRLELGLVVHEFEDRQIGLDAAGGHVESLAGDALGGGLAAQARTGRSENRPGRRPAVAAADRKTKATRRTEPASLRYHAPATCRTSNPR